MSATPDQSERDRQTGRTRLLLALLTISSFLLVGGGIRSWVPAPEEYFYRSKWEFFERHRDEFNAIFLGSSHVFRSFNPRVLDAELHKSGVEWNSFNLALPGSREFEVDFLLREVVASRPQNLRWIILELGALQPTLNENLFTPRTVYWHSTGETWRVLQAVGRDRQPVGERLALGATHVEHFLWRLANLGEGPRIVRALRGAGDPAVMLSDEEWLDNRGYIPLDFGMSPPADGLYPRIRQNRKALATAVAALPEGNRREVREGAIALAALRSQQEAAREIGAEILYVLGPGSRAKPRQYQLLKAGDLEVLFGYNRPRRYPDLYRPQNRFDPSHLNHRGATLLSRIFARELAAFLAGRPPR